jgi:wyosine [tRNA(Phe)-imidazoG37] synthetase (radical SAM superfamily)
MHVRALGRFGFFKIVLVTNGSGLDQPGVREGLRLFTRLDEVWAKLDAGTQAGMDRINQAQVPLAKILDNLLHLGRERPLIIQSLFAQFEGKPPPAEETDQFAQRLLELKNGGAQISLVQIYSATRPTPHSQIGHLPLRTLSQIAQTVRTRTGIRAEVF